MNYTLISGTVKNLQKNKIYEDIAFSDRSKSLIGITSIAAAVVGEGSSSSILASSSGGAEVDMEYYTCSIGEITITGRFHKVGFQDGDLIDFIVTMKDGFAEAYGARNPSQRLIWTLPYRTRGHVAQRWNNIYSSLIISAVSALLALLFAVYNDSQPLAQCWERVIRFSLIGFFIMLSVNILARRPFYHYSIEATKIFETFGFDNPEMIDLQKHHNVADKDFYKQIGQIRPWEITPWQYRYK